MGQPELGKSVPFDVVENQPTVLRVTSLDGVRYVLKLKTVVFEVGQVEGQTAQDGMPAFSMRATIAVDTKREVQ